MRRLAEEQELAELEDEDGYHCGTYSVVIN